MIWRETESQVKGMGNIFRKQKHKCKNMKGSAKSMNYKLGKLKRMKDK